MASFKEFSLTSIHAPSSPQNPRRPGWYISRGNGVFVPLIAADELPDHVKLRGITKRMGATELKETGMQCSSEFMGEVIGDGSTFPLADELIFQESGAKDHRLLSYDGAMHEHDQSLAAPISQSAHGAGAHAYPRSGVLNGYPSVDKTIHTPSSTADDDVGLNTYGVTATRRPPPPSGHEPDASRKVYCTHWIRTGECDYMQQGCYYKHEMPDRATLAQIGFRTIPRWWQEHLAARGTGPAVHTRPQVQNRKFAATAKGLSGILAHREKMEMEEDAASDGASSSDLPMGNPDTGRWTRNHLHNRQPSTQNKIVKAEHVFGKAQPPARVPVCGPNPKAATAGNTQKAFEQAPNKILSRKESIDLITLDMAPLVPTPPRAPNANAAVPQTPCNTPDPPEYSEGDAAAANRAVSIRSNGQDTRVPAPSRSSSVQTQRNSALGPATYHHQAQKTEEVRGMGGSGKTRRSVKRGSRGVHGAKEVVRRA